VMFVAKVNGLLDGNVYAGEIRRARDHCEHADHRAAHENKTGDASPRECIAPTRKNLAFIFHAAWPWSAHLAEAENVARFAL
jgi:hypothetical protein